MENSLGTRVVFAIISKHIERDGVVVQLGHKKMKHGFWKYGFAVQFFGLTEFC